MGRFTLLTLSGRVVFFLGRPHSHPTKGRECCPSRLLPTCPLPREYNRDAEGELGSLGCYWLTEAGKWLPGPRDSLEVAGKATSLPCL